MNKGLESTLIQDFGKLIDDVNNSSSPSNTTLTAADQTLHQLLAFISLSIIAIAALAFVITVGRRPPMSPLFDIRNGSCHRWQTHEEFWDSIRDDESEYDSETKLSNYGTNSV